MEIIWWILLVIALIIIGAVVIVKYVLNQFNSAYKKGKNAISERRNRKVQDAG